MEKVTCGAPGLVSSTTSLVHFSRLLWFLVTSWEKKLLKTVSLKTVYFA